MFPSDSAAAIFARQHPLGRLGPQKQEQYPLPVQSAPPRREPFPAWSAIDETKKKADAFAKEAAREIDAASKKAQEKSGKIEPWSAKYYAACTIGGMMACVCRALSAQVYCGQPNNILG